MAPIKNVRMRCAFRYLFCVLVVILTFISIHLATVSDRYINIFTKNSIEEVFIPNLQSQAADSPLAKLSNFVKSTKQLIYGNKSDMVALTWEEYQNDINAKTGNDLIDLYGQNDVRLPGEKGTRVLLTGEEHVLAEKLIQQYNLNVYASDKIPLNRLVPDSRFAGYVFVCHTWSDTNCLN